MGCSSSGIISAASESILIFSSDNISFISENASLLRGMLLAPSPGGGQRPLTMICPPCILVPTSDATSPMMMTVPPFIPTPQRLPAEPLTTMRPPCIPAPASAPAEP